MTHANGKLHHVLLAGTVSLLLLSGVGTAAAEPGKARGDGERKGWQHRGGHGPMAGMPGRGLLRQLDLSDEQRAQIRTILAEAREEARPARTGMRELHQQIQASIAAGGYNEDQVRILVQSRSELLVDNMIRRIRTMAAVHAVLTPEQQAQLEALRTQRGQRPR